MAQEKADNRFIRQFPELMKGKTIVYVHGFGSSAQTGTVARLRQVLPSARVVAEDIPLHPEEGFRMLRALVEREQPQLILGTSMGGMYAEMLYGFDRILVNPAFRMADTMRAHGMTGTQQFQNPRQDGIQEFYVDKALIKEYREVTEQRFSGTTDEERGRVYGLFGDADTTVDTYDLFRDQYPLSLHFHGEHRMNDKSFMHSVVPVIRWIDDRQQKRERPVIYIGIESLANGSLTTTEKGPQPFPSAMKAVRMLIEHYQVYFVAPADGSAAAITEAWLEEYVNVPAWHHTIYTWRRDLLYGDYLIAASQGRKLEGALATVINFGSDTFKTWDDIIEYFSHLGGQ